MIVTEEPCGYCHGSAEYHPLFGAIGEMTPCPFCDATGVEYRESIGAVSLVTMYTLDLTKTEEDERRKPKTLAEFGREVVAQDAELLKALGNK